MLVVDPHNMIGRQMGEATALPTEVVPVAAATLRPEDRQRAFDFVWRTINERYYDAKLNGVDWNAVAKRYRPLALAAADDDAFWDTLDKMTGELKDAHTRVESPKRVELRKRDESVTLGFSFVPTDGKLAIATVNPESDAWWAGVRPGMTLVAIGGEPAAVAYEKLKAETRLDSTERSRHMRALRRLVTGDPGTSVVHLRARRRHALRREPHAKAHLLAPHREPPRPSLGLRLHPLQRMDALASRRARSTRSRS